MSYQRVKPLGDQVLVRLLPAPTARHGLVIPEQRHHFDYATREGVVLGAGARVREIREGDVVVFAGTTGRWLDPAPGEPALYRAIKEKDVLAVVASA